MMRDNFNPYLCGAAMLRFSPSNCFLKSMAAARSGEPSKSAGVKDALAKVRAAVPRPEHTRAARRGASTTVAA
jgi:hypothetical protein